MRPTAFLFGDFQKLIRDIVETRAGVDGVHQFDHAGVQAGKLLAYARELKKAGQPAHVIHVVVDQTAGEPRDESQYVTLPNEREPDPSSSRAALAKMKEQFSVRYDNQIGIVDHVAPQEDEMIMGRPTANAFFDTNLTKDLRSRKVQNVVICGVATSGIVLASVQGAVERGLAVTVAEDGCMDFGEMHSHVMQYIAKRSKVIQVASIADKEALQQLL